MLTGSVRRVAVAAANRIPFARSNTAYSELSNHDMLTEALRGLVAKTGLEGVRLGEVAGGAVMKHSRDWNLVREVVLSTPLDPATPASLAEALERLLDEDGLRGGLSEAGLARAARFTWDGAAAALFALIRDRLA